MNSCNFCGRRMKKDITLKHIFSMRRIKTNVICSKCKEKFERIEKLPSCSGCSRKQQTQDYCEDCKQWRLVYPEFIPNHQAIFSYNEIAQEYMNRFKFQGDIYLAEIFSGTLHERLSPYSKTHIITSIPSSSMSYNKRGFKAVDLLLHKAGIPTKDVLCHSGIGSLQSSKSRQERLETAQPFSFLTENLHLLNKPILIVDDVYTTGRTIFHARNLLEKVVPTSSMSLFR